MDWQAPWSDRQHPDATTQQETPDALAALRRWESSGATWALRVVGAQAAVVDLITCDGAEIVGRLVSSNPEFVAYVQS